MQREPSGSEKFLQRLSAIIHNLRYILIGALVALVILVIAWAILIEVKSNRTESSTVLVERVQEKFGRWIDTEDAEDRTRMAVEIQGELQRIIELYPKLYATQRAYHILGSLYFRTEEWDLAAESFLKLASSFPKSYLAPIGVINAAVAYEETDAFDLALETYQRIIVDFPDVSPEVPRVLFSLGRLSETVATGEQALEYYNRLVDEYATSSWTKLARDRIIYLNLD